MSRDICWLPNTPRSRLAPWSKDRSSPKGPTENNPYDLAIEGPGFFLLKLPSGEEVYTRSGRFEYDCRSSELCDGEGNHLGIVLPRDAVNLEVSPDGRITGTRINGDGKTEQSSLVSCIWPRFATMEPWNESAGDSTAPRRRPGSARWPYRAKKGAGRSPRGTWRRPGPGRARDVNARACSGFSTGATYRSRRSLLRGCSDRAEMLVAGGRDSLTK